jgi:hypothetical protein
MGWRTTDDVAEFIAVAGEYLRRERARNTVILTVSEQLRVNPARFRPASDAAATGQASRPLLGWWADQARPGPRRIPSTSGSVTVPLKTG